MHSLFLGALLASCVLVTSGSFEVVDDSIGDLNTRVLRNTKTKEYAVIVVDFGGRVEELVLLPHSKRNIKRYGEYYRKHQSEPVPVLLSHNGNATAIKENTWWKGMFLVPWANRIAYGKYTFYNSTYQLPLNEDSTNPPRKNSMHGLLAGKILSVKSATATKSSAVLTLTSVFKDENDGYPFTWLYEITYTLSADKFDISITISNPMATTPLPMYIGWHPYFLCTTNEAVITFDTCTGWNHIELNSNANPTGITAHGMPFDGNTPIGGNATNPTSYDDEYKATMPPSVCSEIKTKLYDPGTDKTIVLYQSPEMRFLQVFTGLTGTIAIEPMSGMADAFNNHDHLTILSGAGNAWQGSFGVYLE